MVTTHSYPSSAKPVSTSSNHHSSSASPPIIVTTSRTTTITATSKRPSQIWSHTPSNLTLLWLLISLPLVLWDTGYVLLRPYSMPGGSLHSPIWKPYALYGTIDYIYGFPAWEAKNGFTAAQAALNVVETVGYIVYLWIMWRQGRQENVSGRGAPSKNTIGMLGNARVVHGRMAAWAVLIGFGASLMTVSKTVLYWANEYFSGFANIGHNDAFRLILMWIVPNGAWLVLPSYMIYVFGLEILQGLKIAAGERQKRS